MDNALDKEEAIKKSTISRLRGDGKCEIIKGSEIASISMDSINSNRWLVIITKDGRHFRMDGSYLAELLFPYTFLAEKAIKHTWLKPLATFGTQCQMIPIDKEEVK